MSNKESLIEYLTKNGKGVRSWESIAFEFKISTGEVARTIWKRHRKVAKIVHKQEVANYISDLEDRIVSMEEDKKTGNVEKVLRSKNEIKTEAELIEAAKIDLSKYRITRVRHNYWGNSNDPHWQVRVDLEPLTTKEKTTAEFIKFLETFSPAPQILQDESVGRTRSAALLILNKQDAHLDKYDELGDNDIFVRFSEYQQAVKRIVNKASLFSGLYTKYILGSDEFNSEWMNTTTKGTPQVNLLPFHQRFQLICNHEIKIIEQLAQASRELEVVYVPGNHDEYLGWHLVTWLSAYFKNTSHITFDISPLPTKYFRFGNSALMFNHGNEMKPEKMAQIFPMDFKSEWSKCNYQYIFAGDKHMEKNADFAGIKFYGLPAFSKAKSGWELQKGLIGKSEVSGFLIQEDKGLSDIYKESI